MFCKGIIHKFKTVASYKDFFRNRMDSTSRLPPLSLRDIHHTPVSVLKKTYGETESISKKIQDILKVLSKPNSGNVVEPEFVYNKLWTCSLGIPIENFIQKFEGRGITKKTAEHNCKLAALLWLQKKYSLPEAHLCDPKFHFPKLEEKKGSDNIDKNVPLLKVYKELSLGSTQMPQSKVVTQNTNFSADNFKFNSIQQRLCKFKPTYSDALDHTVNMTGLKSSTITSESNLSAIKLSNQVIKRRDTINLRPIEWYLGLNKSNSVQIKNQTYQNVHNPDRTESFSRYTDEQVGRPRFKFDWSPIHEYLLGTNPDSNVLPKEIDTIAPLVETQDSFSAKKGEHPVPGLHNTLISRKLVKNPVNKIQSRQISSFSTNLLRESGQKSLENSLSHEIKSPLTDLNENKSTGLANYQTNEKLFETFDITKFPKPKETLHNFYQIVSSQLKIKFELAPHYKTISVSKDSNLWECSYKLKWPIEVKVSAKAHTKKEASKLASQEALRFLQKQNKITKDGLPVIFEKSQIKSVKLDLKLTAANISDMKSIMQLFDQKISPNISNLNLKNVENVNLEFTQRDSMDFSVIYSQKYLGFDTYIAKEKIDLPIVQLKQQFMELFANNRVIIVKGEPGCGKSTRIPQYVLEAWAHEALPSKPCRIVVTQPRKIAAISLAQRVSAERMESLGSIVGYQVRFDSNFQPKTGRILYCTTGILLRHLQADPLLRKFTCVILDEAHERDVNADILMSLLRQALKNNCDLKIVVMSATIDTDVFQQYFLDSKVLSVPGVTYPVTRYFLDNCRSLNLNKTVKNSESEYPSVIHDEVVEVIGYICKNKPEGAILVFLPGWDDIAKILKSIPQRNDLMVLPLHSKLQHSEQAKIFSKPPPGIRKIILATNIAETSITIDDIVYVVDTGIFKSQVYDVEKSVDVMDKKWISKASVAQRSGRAGRCQQGESFHLYTTARYNSFADYNIPQILETSLTKIVLDSKMFSNNKNAVEWMNELLTPPEETAVVQAVQSLKDLELLDSSENLTPLGRILVNFQLEPKLAKTMVNSVIYKCTTPIVDIVTLYSANLDIFNSVSMDKETIRKKKTQFSKTSDHLAVLRLFEKWLELNEEFDSHAESRLISSFDLVPHKLRYIQKLRTIHFDYLRNGLKESVPITDDCSDCDEIVKGVLFGGVGNLLYSRNWEIIKNIIRSKHVLITKNNHRAQIAQESVNHKKNKIKFFTYIDETLSNVRKTTIIRESSALPSISVILFSHNDCTITEVDSSNDDENRNKVKINLQNMGSFRGTFICDQSDTQLLLECRAAMRDCYNYYVYKITSGGERIDEVDKAWTKILFHLNNILQDYKSE